MYRVKYTNILDSKNNHLFQNYALHRPTAKSSLNTHFNEYMMSSVSIVNCTQNTTVLKIRQ